MTTPSATFYETIRLIRPSTEELRWREIPWQTDIAAACRLGDAKERPIFLWAMNGNPLGCT